MPARIEVGGRGQFDVMLGEEVVASKERGGVLRWLFRGGDGFPDEEEVVEALAERLTH